MYIRVCSQIYFKMLKLNKYAQIDLLVMVRLFTGTHNYLINNRNYSINSVLDVHAA